MSEAYRRLSAQLPERRVAAAGAFASEPRALRAWIEALPMANYRSATRQLLDGLRRLNAQRVDPAQRLEALELLRAPLAQLALATDRQIIGASFPLPAQKADLGEIALDFQAELSLGYRIALVELCAPSGSVGFLRGKSVALAGVRALQHLHELLVRAYVLYRTPPQGAWQGLHDVHAFLAAAKLDDRGVDDAVLGGSHAARLIYTQSLLLALSNPYHYTQREQGDVVALTRALAPNAALGTGTPGDQDVAVPRDRDEGPGYLLEERADGESGQLVLRLAPVLAFVTDQQSATPPGARVAHFRVRGGAGVAVETDLVRRVASALGARAVRARERLAGGYAVDTVLGLNDLHFVLAGNEDFEGFLRSVRGQAISLSESDRAASWRLAAADPGRSTRMQAQVVDQSLGGYRLLWERTGSGETLRVRVAELVGLALPERRADARADWMVGIVRWLRIDDSGRVDAGIELLARRALAVGVRASDAAEARASLRGLLLAPLESDTCGGYSNLLTSTELGQDGTAIELVLPADMQGAPAPARTVRIGGLGLVETTGVYHHFALAAPEPDAVGDADGEPPAHDEIAAVDE